MDEKRLASLSSLSEAERASLRRQVRDAGYRALGPVAKAGDEEASRVLRALDEKGRWVSVTQLKAAKGERVRSVSCAAFTANAAVLCAWLERGK